MPQESQPYRSLLRIAAVQERTGLSRSQLYRLVNDGEFPAPVKLSERTVAWPSDAVSAWIESRIQASQEARTA